MNFVKLFFYKFIEPDIRGIFSGKQFGFFRYQKSQNMVMRIWCFIQAAVFPDFFYCHLVFDGDGDGKIGIGCNALSDKNTFEAV
ncbi:hypothetical protein [Kingella potus]|uniref:hypothetical protein n=1 Tax=Kingella potus TaxID=265175 RepID=UPI0011C05CBC|nr:hypothetical protein [Kingella potus]